MPIPQSLALFERFAANHLWQSTAFAAVAALLALALKGNHARVRHWLWLAASVKFLVPFSVLTDIGGILGRWLLSDTPVSQVPVVVDQIVRPFALIPVPLSATVPIDTAPAASTLWPSLIFVAWLCGFAAVLLHGWMRWRRVASAVRSATPITEGRAVQAFRRIQWAGPNLPRLVAGQTNLEPGAFGIFRPVICLPAGIDGRLDDAELEAVLTHELCHIRRRDNAASLLHMAVEAIFWFHPLVWWLGARLTEECERAVDEAVVRMGGEPQVYAESILKVCEFYIASPVACASGVTGGDLKKRIEGIMTNPFARAMNPRKKLLLAIAAAAAVAGPFAFGILTARAQTPAPPLPHFEVASIRLTHTGQGGAGDRFPVNGTWRWKSITVPTLIGYAYYVSSATRIEGVPKSLMGPDPGFDIVAKMPLKTSRHDFRLMLQSLLAERFQARIHTETRDIPVNTIELAKGGLKLKPASGNCVTVEGSASVPPGQHRCHDIEVQVGMSAERIITWEYAGWSASMADLAATLSSNNLMVDDTGLSGLYDFDVKVVVQAATRENVDDQSDWTYAVKTSWEKQAGLLIDLSKTKKRPGTVVVVDHVEMPSPN